MNEHRMWERGAATIEHVALVAGIVVATSGIAVGLAPSGPTLAREAARAIERSISGDRRAVSSGPPARRGLARSTSTTPTGVTIVDRQAIESVARWSDGDGSSGAPRPQVGVADDEDASLQWALARREYQRGGARLELCAMCASGSVTTDVVTGASARTTRTSVFEAGARASAMLALVAAEATAQGTRSIGPAVASSSSRLRGVVGGDASGAARVEVGRSGATIVGRGRAVAGASARAEQSFGVDVFGAALRANAAAEGWAGAGAMGHVEVSSGSGRTEIATGWGAALGFGGASEWRVSVDTSQMSPRGRAAAAAGLRGALAGIGGTSPLGAVLAGGIR